MDPLRYCQDKAAPEGSIGYYTVLFQPPRHRAALLAFMALECELREVVEDCSEPAVSLHKLAFWREQLARLLGGEASHPVCVALLNGCTQSVDTGAVGTRAIDAALLERLLRGITERINLAQVPSMEALDSMCRETAGVVGECMAGIVAPGRGEIARDNAVAGAAIERIRLLRLPRRAGRPPHCGIPLEVLTRSGATPSQVDAGGNSEPVQVLRRALLASARETVATTMKSLGNRRGLAATRLRLGLVEARTLQRSGYEPNGSAGRSLPITLLWNAWRSRPRDTN